MMPARRFLPPSLFLACILSAVMAPSAPAQVGPAYVINDTIYSARADEKKFEVNATYKVELLYKGLTAIKLLPPDAAIIGFSTSKLPISTAKFFLRRSPSGCEAVVEEKGKYEIKIKFVVKIDRSGSTARAGMPFPISSRNELSLDIPEPDLKLVVRPDLPIEFTSETRTATSARLFPPAIEKLELEWYPKSLAKELEAVLVAEDGSLLTFSDGLLRRRTNFNYTITRGKISSLSLRLPTDTTLRELKGDLVEKWTAVDRTVEVKLKQEVEKSFQIALHTEEPVPPCPAVVKIEPIATVEASRQRGSMAMCAEEGLTLRDRGAVGARQADISAERFREAELPVRLAYAYDSLPVEISVGLERATAKIEAVCESHVELERGVVTIRSNFNYQIKDSGVYEFKLKLHEGLSVLEVRGGESRAGPSRGKLAGETIQTDDGLPAGVKLQPLDSEVKDNVLTVRTRQRAFGRYFLQVVAQMNIVEINGVVIPRIETIGTESETGAIGISVGPGVNLQHHSATKTRQIDVNHLPPWLIGKGCKIGYTYDQAGGALSVKTIKIEPEITAKEYEYVAIEENWVRQEVLFALEIEKAGMFNFRLKIPDDMTVTEVRGQGIADWAFKQDVREVWANLTAEVRGGYAFQVFAERRIENLAAEIPLGGIELMDTKKLDGWLGVGPRASIDLRADQATGLQKIGVEKMPAFYRGYPEMIMAYTYSSAAWGLRLRTIILEPQLDVETFSLLRFQSGLMTAVEEVHLDIKKAEIKEVEVVLPPKAVNSSVDGEEIKTSELVGGTWHVTLRNKMKGRLVVWVNYEQTLGGASVRMEFTGIKIPNAHEQKGFIIVGQEKSDVEIKPAVISAAAPVDESVLPADFVSRVTIPIVRTYRFTGPDRAVAFEITSHARADVAKARAESCIIKTVVKPQGQAINYLTFNVFNSRKQFLKVNLGEGAELWGTYISGAPVKSNSSDDGGVLIPIMSKGGANKSFDVSIIWANPMPRLGLMKTIDFITPDPDIQVGKVEWDVFFPRDYQIRGTSGNMQMLETGARDVGLVAIIWSYVSVAVSLLVHLLYGLLFPVGVIAIAVLLLGWLWLTMRWQLSLGRAIFWIVILLVAAGLAYSLLPTLGRARESARRVRIKTEMTAERLREDYAYQPSETAKKSEAEGVLMPQRKAAPAAGPQVRTVPADEIGVRQQALSAAKPDTRYSSERAKELHEKMGYGGRRGAAGVDYDLLGRVGEEAAGEKIAAEEPQQMLLRKQKTGEADAAKEQQRRVQEIEANQMLQRAMSNLKDNRLEDAQRDLERAVALDKSNIDAKQELDKVKGIVAVAGAQFQQAQQLELAEKEEAPALREEKSAADRARAAGKPALPPPPAPGKAAAEPLMEAKEIARKNELLELYEKGKKLHDAGKWREAGGVLQQVAGSGVDLGGYRMRSAGNMLANVKKHLSAGLTPAALGVGTIEAQIAQQQREIARDGEGATMLATVIGGKAKGVMPIELTFPTAGTVPYRFEMPLAGDVQGKIRMSCIRIGAALCLQGVIGIAILAAALGFGWRRTWGAMIACGIALVILWMAKSALASPASYDYYLVAIWSALLAILILAVRIAVGRMTKKAL